MTLRETFLSGAALVLFASPAFADEAAIEKRLDEMQQMIQAQQKQIESQKSEIGQLRKALSKRGVKMVAEAPAAPAPSPAPAPIEARMTAEEQKTDALVARLEAEEAQTRVAKQDQPIWSFAGGRPTITSADGRFSLALRALGQFDTAYYMQSARAALLPAGNDLSSGSNFRRVYLGVGGTLFGDWAYNFNYDFGGSGGTETPGHIQSVYLEYDGLKPFGIRIGAFPPSASLEDNTSPADTPFLERNSPADLARNIAGGDGRDALAIFYAGDQFYGSLAYTGDKIADSSVFDEQQALLGRVSYLAVSSDDLKVVASANGSYVFKIADSTAGNSATRAITLSDPPELTIDDAGTKLITTGTLNAESVTQWGVEGAVQWDSLYSQAGYFGYNVDQRGTAPSYSFDGWYGEATWVLSGDHRIYNPATASFSNPKPSAPFSLKNGDWGAWEVAARYSDLNLNDNAGVLGQNTPVGGLRGGDQRILTGALNWYPNSNLKIELQVQNVEISRLGTFQGTVNEKIGQAYDTIALRTQIQF
ncbi:MAG TPA: porin [Rhizomicrobium sp.]|nr:porin [Rhizomicrobium sp.]